MRSPCLLQIEKLTTIFLRRDRARIVLAEDAVTVSRDPIVAPISQPQRKQLQRRAQGTPSSAKFSQSHNRSVGARRNSLIGKRVVQHYVHGVEVVWGSVVPSQYLSRKIALQGGKAEAVVRIVFQKELNQPVAEAADAVVENDRIGAGGGHAVLLLMLRQHRAADRSVRPTRYVVSKISGRYPVCVSSRARSLPLLLFPADRRPAPVALGRCVKIPPRRNQPSTLR